MAQHIFTGAGAPAGTPSQVGHHYIDTTNDISYISVGTSSAADWKTTDPAAAVAAGVGLVEQQSFHILDPLVMTYVLTESAAFAERINTLIIKLSSGTATAAVQINGVNVTGLSALSITTVQQTFTATAARDIAIGDRVTLVLSASSLPLDLTGTLKKTRL